MAGGQSSRRKGKTPVSMTGFGKSTLENEAVALEVEMKSVNHRFLDLSFKLPRPYVQFEQDLRAQISGKAARGRIECFVQRKPKSAVAYELNFNRALFEAYMSVYQKECGKLSNDQKVSLTVDLLGRREILDLQEGESSEEAEKDLLFRGVREALENLAVMRNKEGARLGEEITERFESVTSIEAAIEKEAKGMSATLKTNLLGRIKKLSPEVKLDPTRLAAEVAIAADRVDVTEELVRLKSHQQQFQEALSEPSSGRKLDFIIQEMGREFNTIGSKAQSAKVQRLVVEAKAELEKLKEQVQNIE